MAQVKITKKLEEEINKIFKDESVVVFSLIYSLKEHPHKGKIVGLVGGILIKELRYESFRFYFITDRYKLKLLEKGELVSILIKFVRMSDKKDQQKIIDEIKHILRVFGEEKFK